MFCVTTVLKWRYIVRICACLVETVNLLYLFCCTIHTVHHTYRKWGFALIDFANQFIIAVAIFYPDLNPLIRISIILVWLFIKILITGLFNLYSDCVAKVHSLLSDSFMFILSTFQIIKYLFGFKILVVPQIILIAALLIC